jgi:methylated-DNA-[protein]-cysteine S-methyltransferase
MVMKMIDKINRATPENLSVTYWTSPVGLIEVQCTEGGLRASNFVDDRRFEENGNAHNAVTMNQLEEYFSGRRRVFDLVYDIEGTAFQKRVWAELLKIPFGKTCSYMDIAKRLGDPKTIRAVGLANGQNKIGIIFPCHRVIGSDGSLVGYAGGLSRKKWLLEFENPPTQLNLF